MTTRNANTAGALSLIAPGLGQIYNSQATKGAAFCAAQFALLLSAGFTLDYFWGCVVLMAGGLSLWIFSISEATHSAKSSPLPELKWYNRWYFYVVYFVLLHVSGSFAKDELRENYFRAFKAPTSSMETTLQIGDNFVAAMHAYKKAPPARGDVVVFSIPEAPDVLLVKRVVAIPGDTVELRSTELLLNGKSQDEPYARYIRGGMKDFGPVTIPDGTVFILGDNRDQSKDSRYFLDPDGMPAPFIPHELVFGKVRYVYWNSALRTERIGVVVR